MNAGELNQLLAEAVERAAESVVRVDGGGRRPSSGTVWTEGNTIASILPCVEKGDGVRVSQSTGQFSKAEVLGRDDFSGLAVLRTAEHFKAPQWAQLSGLKTGHLVLALSRPGNALRSHLGTVSAVGNDGFFEVDYLGSPQVSGGPVINLQGEVLGLTQVATRRRASRTLLTDEVEKIVAELLKFGRVRKGYLGIGAYPSRQGLVVVSIETDSAASKGALLVGDLLVSLNHQPISNIEELWTYLEGDTIGQSLSVQIIRAGNPMEVSLTVGERP